MPFPRNHVPWNKGKTGVQFFSDETKRKMSGKSSAKKNKTFEEIYGIKKAMEIKQK